MKQTVNSDLTFLKDLGHDVVQNYRVYEEDPNSQTIRRNLIRSECAYIEGTIWFLKKILRSHINEKQMAPHWKVMLYLCEMDFTITNSGEIKEQDKRIGTISNLKAFLRCCFELYALKVDFNSKGWSELQKTFQVRDRLMHPSSQKSIEVSDKEIKSALVCHQWYEDTKGELLEILIKF